MGDLKRPRRTVIKSTILFVAVRSSQIQLLDDCRKLVWHLQETTLLHTRLWYTAGI